MYAAISADVVSSTSLSVQAMIALNKFIKEELKFLESRYDGLWGRIVRGDTIECVLERPEKALEVAILLKCKIKSFHADEGSHESKFCKYGLRLAIGIGDMKVVDRKLDMMDGEAIYRSGRSLDNLVGWAKYQMIISMDNDEYADPLNIMLSFINHSINNATSRKCLILYERLLSGSSNEAAEKIGISVSGINQTLNDLGWNSIAQSIKYYRKVMLDNVV